MHYPSLVTGVEGIYRNPLTEVQSFFNKRHAGHYKVQFNIAMAGLFYD